VIEGASNHDRQEVAMVTIGMNYAVLPGKEQVFERAVNQVIDVMKSMEGHSNSSLFRQVGQEAPTYLIVSDWNSEEAYTAFIRSEKFRKVTSWGLAEVLRGRPSHTTYHQQPSAGGHSH